MSAAEQQVSVSRVIGAPADRIFAFLADPTNHPRMDGQETVQDVVSGGGPLRLGSKFRMRMRVGLPYRITSKVVEYEENRRIAWCHYGKHRWRYELEPVDGGTRVTETFDYSTALSPMFLERTGYPRRNRANMERTLERLEELLT